MATIVILLTIILVPVHLTVTLAQRGIVDIGVEKGQHWQGVLDLHEPPSAQTVLEDIFLNLGYGQLTCLRDLFRPHADCGRFVSASSM